MQSIPQLHYHKLSYRHPTPQLIQLYIVINLRQLCKIHHCLLYRAATARPLTFFGAI